MTHRACNVDVCIKLQSFCPRIDEAQYKSDRYRRWSPADRLQHKSRRNFIAYEIASLAAVRCIPCSACSSLFRILPHLVSLRRSIGQIIQEIINRMIRRSLSIFGFPAANAADFSARFYSQIIGRPPDVVLGASTQQPSETTHTSDSIYTKASSVDGPSMVFWVVLVFTCYSPAILVSLFSFLLHLKRHLHDLTYALSASIGILRVGSMG